MSEGAGDDGEAADSGGVDDTAADGESDGDDAYGGVLGAFPYAFRVSDSRLFKSYVLLGGLVAAFIVLQFAISVVVVVSNTLGVGGGTFTFVRSFVIVVGFFVLAPVVAPVLFVARRNRRQGEELHPRYDFLLGVGGYLFLAALYVGLVISMPECFQFGKEMTCRPEPSGLFEPVIRFLYGLPPLAGLVPPTVAGVGIYLLDRYLS